MKTIIIATAVALSFSLGGFAGPSDKKTTIEIRETLLIPGKQLPPGKYVMKLVDSPSNRHIVQIFNADESQVHATILAIPNYRLRPTGDTALGYWETPAGSPPALRSWFYPGDNFGQEFAYPKAMAEKLAAQNKAKVPWYEGQETAEYTVDSLRQTHVEGFDETAVPEATAQTRAEARPMPVTPAPPPAAEPSPEQLAPPPASAVNDDPEAEPAPEPLAAAEPQTTAAEEPVLLAQNRTPEPEADQEPPSSLPQTASPYALLLATGVGLVLLGRSLAS